MQTDVYQKLAQALDLLPGGYPPTKSGVERQILKKIFSPEEALLAADLIGSGETAEAIAERANLPVQEVTEKLEAMLSNDLIWGSEKDGLRKFRLAPFIVGFYESQWDIMDHELAHLCEQFWNEGGAEGIMRIKPALHRVVPAQQALKTEVVLPYDDIKSLLQQAKWFTAIDCICRKQQDLINARKCNFPLKACLTFSMVERPEGSNNITQEEALQLLDDVEEIGLVHTVRNVARGIFYVCNCCGCCCGILRGINQFGIAHSVARANYYAVVDPEQCNACDTCEERCQVNACSVADVATIDLDKCIGCGLCVTGCAAEAVTLKLRPDAEIITPPDNYRRWEQQRLHNRGLLQ
ncbi:ATP-binding protein [Chloroflexota bacterium]